jgi:hypothetical protein
MFGKAMAGIQGKVVDTMYDVERRGAKDAMKWVEALPDAKVAKAAYKAARWYKPILQTQLTEGAQEGAQFAASEFARDYVGSGYNDMVDSATKALSQTFGTKEGLENMVIGFIVGGGQSLVSKVVGAEKKAAKLKGENTAKALELLNNGGILNAMENMESSEAMIKYKNALEKSMEAGDMITAEIMRNRIISNMASRYQKVGAMDYFYEQLDDLAGMDEAEFKKSLGYSEKGTIEEQTGKTQQEIVGEIKDRAESSVRRTAEVRDILRAYTPSKNLINSLVGSFQTEETKTSKALVEGIRRAAANVMLNLMVDMDTVDRNIDNTYENIVDLVDKFPSGKKIASLISEDLIYKIKIGEISFNEKGELMYSAKSTIEEAENSKALKEIQEINRAIDVLHPVDGAKIRSQLSNLNALVKSREMLIGNYSLMTSSNVELEKYIKEVEETKKLQDKKAANDLAQTVIENAETVDEINREFPQEADEEFKSLARKKREELYEKEQALTEKYNRMNTEDFENIDEDSLDPINATAYRNSIRKRAEDEADARASKTITVETEKGPEPFIADLTYTQQQVLTETKVGEGQGTFIINGRKCIIEFEDPIDAISTDLEGNPVAVRLLDFATGKPVVFKVTKETDTFYGEAAEKENAIVDAIVNAILMADNSIRSDRSISAEEALENFESVVEGAIEDGNKIEAFEKEATKLSNLPDAEVDSLLNDPKKTSGLTNEQLRAQIEVLQNEIESNNAHLLEYNQIANEYKLSSRERQKNPAVKELNRKNTLFKKALKARVQELGKRKAIAKAEQADLTQGQVQDEIEQAPTDTESGYTISSTDTEIQRLQKELEELEKQKSFYQDYIDGKYEDVSQDDIDTAEIEIKKLNRKIGAKKGQITKRNNLISKINEDVAERESAEDGATTGPVQQAEGEASEGTEFAPTAGVDEETQPGISEEEAERLRKIEEAKTKSPYSPKPTTAGPAQAAPAEAFELGVETIQFEGPLDVQLSPIEYKTVETANSVKVLVRDGKPIDANEVKHIGKDGNEILVNPAFLTDPSMDMDDYIVEFEVREDTDYWIGISDEIEESKHYEKVPIFVQLVNKATGVETRVGILQSSKDGKGVSRKDIYDLYKKGLTPQTTAKKLFGGRNNIANSTTVMQEAFMSPISTIVNAPNSQVQGIGVVRIKKGVPIIIGDNIAPVNNSSEQFPDFETSGLTPGQVVVIVRNPDGILVPIPLSTKDITPEAVQSVKEAILNENAGVVSDIVGMNVLPVSVEDDAATIVTEEEEMNDSQKRTYMASSTTTGKETLFLFYSESAGSIVKISGTELKKALEGRAPKFSFVEAATNEKGFVEMMNVSKDRAAYAAVEKSIGKEFMDAVATKKYQVSVNELKANEAFTSPVTGTKYNSYLEYLSSESEIISETEDEGSKAVLATDIAVMNKYGSPYFNLGLKFDGLSTREKEVVAEQDLADTIATDDLAESTVYEVTTPAPVSTDAKDDIKRRRQEDSKKPSKDSVFYNLIERLSKGSVTLANLIDNLGSKLKSSIKTSTGEITGISFNQGESRFSFTHRGKELVGYFTDGKWEIGKLTEKGNYNYISYDEIADINKKYGSQKEFLQSINKELVSDIENFEKLKYTKEESSSGIIPLENSISKKADELRVKYGNTYLLQDFLKEYDAELAALEEKTSEKAPVLSMFGTEVPTDVLNYLAELEADFGRIEVDLDLEIKQETAPSALDTSLEDAIARYEDAATTGETVKAPAATPIPTGANNPLSKIAGPNLFGKLNSSVKTGTEVTDPGQGLSDLTNEYMNNKGEDLENKC